MPSLLGRKKKRAPALMLTPLLDMFTIILIFLLVSFDNEDYDFRLQEGLTPPKSSAQSIFKPAVNVAITKSGVLVERDELLALTDGKAPEELYAADLAPAIVDRLKEIYAERFAANDVAVPEDGSAPEGDVEEDDAILIIQADKDLDYRTIHLVMSSAREAGFYKYRLVVVRK